MEYVISSWTELGTRRQAAIFGTLTATLLLISLQVASRNVRPTNAVLLLLMMTLLMSETFGFRAGLVSALVSDAVLIFFFFEPIFSFWANDLQLRLTLGIFLVVSALAGSIFQDRRSRRVPQPGHEGVLPPGRALPMTSAFVAVPTPVASTGPEPTLQIDRDNHVVLVNGREVLLTPTEFTLLDFLSMNAGRVLSHQLILSSVWGDEYVDDTQILRTYVKQLRAKLGDQSSAPRFIRTESRLGYRFMITGGQPG